jgi:hypothetical protein
MDAYSLFNWLEIGALSVWVREAPTLWAFPFILILHTVGMGFLVGTNVALDLRVLGFAPRIRLSLFEKNFFVMKIAFVVNAISGILLLIGYPTKALTNPLFYIKLGLIAIALVQIRSIRKQVLRAPEMDTGPVSMKGKVLAGTSIAIWAAAVTAGRFLAYTYSYLMAEDLL